MKINGIIDIKIGGTTGTVEKRICQLKTGCPLNITSIRTIPVIENYRTLEGKLHARYSTFRINGEWFRFTEKELTEILTSNFT